MNNPSGNEIGLSAPPLLPKTDQLSNRSIPADFVSRIVLVAPDGPLAPSALRTHLESNPASAEALSTGAKLKGHALSCRRCSCFRKISG